MKRLNLIAIAIGLLISACSEVDGAEPSEPRKLVLEMPEAAEEMPGMSEKFVRFSALRNDVEARALEEAGEFASLPKSFFEQVGIRGDRMLIGAIGPEGGVYYVVPFFGEYPGPDGDDPWDNLRREGGRDIFDACRFEIRTDNLPEPGRFASRTRSSFLWADPQTCEAQDVDTLMAEFPYETEGYSTFREQELDDGVRAALIEREDGNEYRFDPDGALDQYAGDRSIALSLALPSYNWESGFARTGDGAELFFYRQRAMSAGDALCVLEGIGWDAFRDFQSSPAMAPREWCDAAFADQREAARERYRERTKDMPPPVIRTQ